MGPYSHSSLFQICECEILKTSIVRVVVQYYCSELDKIGIHSEGCGAFHNLGACTTFGFLVRDAWHILLKPPQC
jgi:hypothetical protein